MRLTQYLEIYILSVPVLWNEPFKQEASSRFRCSMCCLRIHRVLQGMPFADYVGHYEFRL